MFECHSDILRTEGQGEGISGVVRKMMGFCTSVDAGIGVSLLTQNHIPWVQGASPLSLKLSANYNRGLPPTELDLCYIALKCLEGYVIEIL